MVRWPVCSGQVETSAAVRPLARRAAGGPCAVPPVKLTASCNYYQTRRNTQSRFVQRLGSRAPPPTAPPLQSLYSGYKGIDIPFTFDQDRTELAQTFDWVVTTLHSTAAPELRGEFWSPLRRGCSLCIVVYC